MRTWKIWIDPPRIKRRKFWLAIIHDTQEEMWEYGDRLDNACSTKSIPHNYLARATSYHIEYRDNGRWKRAPQRGTLLFYLDGVSAAVVSHEATHAVNYEFKLRFKDHRKLDSPKGDEWFAWTQGYIVNQFWWKWYRYVRDGRTKADPYPTRKG